MVKMFLNSINTDDNNTYVNITIYTFVIGMVGHLFIILLDYLYLKSDVNVIFLIQVSAF